MTEANPDQPGSTPEARRSAYRALLKRYDAALLLGIAEELGVLDPKKPAKASDRIADHWSEDARILESRLEQLPAASRVALSCFALLETGSLPGADLLRAVRLLGLPLAEALDSLVRRAILLIDPGRASLGTIDPNSFIRGEPGAYSFLLHPDVAARVRPTPPPVSVEAYEGSVRQTRRCDGLEVILRLAAVWQRVSESPMRRTMSGSFFKRDRERLEDDPAIVGPIADSLEPMPDMALLWVELAEAVGMVLPEIGTDRLVAAPADYWSDNAVHLPQMVAVRWLASSMWHELGGARTESTGADLSTVGLRLAVMFSLASVPAEAWVAIASIVEAFDLARPRWTQELWPARGETAGASLSSTLVEAVLLGPAYQFGLIESAEESTSGRRLVRLSPLGRYAMAIGPPPSVEPPFEHFLYVQPNFEIIAYRQGLTPSIIGRFSRFTRWTKLGAAIEMRLTPDSVYRGLEGGLTPDDMLGLLRRHSSRPLPSSVEDSVRTWSGRRERVTYHASATLIEFATPEELEAALEDWPPGRETPIRISPRLLLVDDVSSIPFQRFRQAGARDYRKPSEPCVDLDADGVTLAIELGRSDLLVDAEIIRFADEQPARADAQTSRRRFVVNRRSLARGVEGGLTSASLGRWYLQRTGEAMPASVRLMLHAVAPEGPPIEVSRPRLLAAPSPELLDGLLQHPATRDAFIERVGPRHAVVADAAWPALAAALEDLGLELGRGGVLSDGLTSPVDRPPDSIPRR
ncbi:MAG: helicase-associated domain-containing protein [Isosphaeraceae bacterium]|nr:helicase-associated domain-containing protein [Isosphaeraceae bacterium]